ncbi:MAG: hypothetical protein U0414_38570 [Polyangiaceae bacterium]
MFPFIAVVLTIASVMVVYDPTMFALPANAGMVGLFVTVPAAVYLLWVWTRPKPTMLDREVAYFAAFGDRTPALPAPEKPGAKEILPQPTAKIVTAPPSDIGFILDQVGGGKPVAFLEVHPKNAYIAIVGSDEGAISDYTSILLRLEAKAPAFELHPLVTGDPLPARTIGFKDQEFAAAYVTQGEDPKGVRTFMIPELREELLENADIHVVVHDKAMALTVFGPFERARAMKLLDVADVFFAEYGADGGPSLREGFDKAAEAAEAKTNKKKKKKKAREDGPMGESPLSAET